MKSKIKSKTKTIWKKKTFTEKVQFHFHWSEIANRQINTKKRSKETAEWKILHTIEIQLPNNSIPIRFVGFNIIYSMSMHSIFPCSAFLWLPSRQTEKSRRRKRYKKNKIAEKIFWFFFRFCQVRTSFQFMVLDCKSIIY